MTKANQIYLLHRRTSRYSYTVPFIVGLFIISISALNFLSPPKAAAAGCGPTQTFKTVWKTDNTGTSNSTSITIPTTGTGYSYRVDINNDGDFADTIGTHNEATLRTGSTTINFGTAGTYPVAICGTFPRIFFNNAGDRLKLLDITQWGDNAWTSMQNAFYGASNMDVTATDVPNVTAVTNMSQLFRNTALVGNASFNNWDTGNVTSMYSIFYNAPNFNQPIGNWDTSSVLDMSNMFFQATAFNQDLSDWDTSSVTNMTSMFREAPAFNGAIGTWDTSNVIFMSQMFQDSINFNQPIGDWDTGNVTTMFAIFTRASAFNQPIGDWDTSNVTDMYAMFMGLRAVTALPNVTLIAVPMSFNQDISRWDTSNVTTMYGMFLYNPEGLRSLYESQGYTNITIQGDTSLKHPFNQNLGNWDISSVTDMTGMFSGSSLSEADYDATLTGWSSQNLQSGVVLGAHSLSYCNSEVARQTIIDTYGWNIQGDAELCTPAAIVPGVPNTGSEIKHDKTVIIQATVFLMTGSVLYLLYWFNRTKRGPERR